jgi:PilZ domain-containing protein
MVKRMMTPAAYRHVNGTLVERKTDSGYKNGAGFLTKTVGRDRRATRRFPIELPAELCIRQMRFRGTTVNISSGGLLLKCSYDSVKMGKRVKVRITGWPNSNGNKSDVALIMEGAVVRGSRGYLAVRRTRYEFVEA